MLEEYKMTKKLIRMDEDEFRKKYKAGEKDFRRILLKNPSIYGLKAHGYIIDLRGADFTGARLYGLGCFDVDLRDAKFKDAVISGYGPTGLTRLGGDFRGADFSGTTFKEVVFCVADLKGVTSLDHNLKGISELERTDLSGLDLSGGDLRKKYLHRVKLIETDLRGTDLRKAFLACSDLREAYFGPLKGDSGEELVTRLEGADLRRADLRGIKGLETVLDLGRAKCGLFSTNPGIGAYRGKTIVDAREKAIIEKSIEYAIAEDRGLFDLRE